MEINRNQYLFVAIFLMLIGMQMRLVSSYVLTQEATQFIAERTMKSPSESAGSFLGSVMTASETVPARVVYPPEWLGFCLLSVGAVLFFHSMTMKRPE